MAGRSAERRERVTRGTGNVFADLGFPDAAERQARLRLAFALNQELEARKISQADAAKVLGVTQPKVSALRHYKLAGFSVERLMNLLTALDRDVEIVIRRKPVRGMLGLTSSALQVPMVRKTKPVVEESRSFTMARRRALRRLRKGLDLRWISMHTRDELYRRERGAASRR